MKLYIANGSTHLQDFNYRIPGINKVLSQPISIGGQICIPRDLTQEQVDHIVEHHKIYGMIPANEIGSRRSRAAAYAYQVGKPFDPEVISQLMSINRGVMIETGEQTRKDAAVVIATELGKSARDQRDGSADLAEVEIDVIEEDGRTGNKSPENVIEKIIATPENRQQRRQGRR